jgi:uncharacterized protein
MAAFRDAAAYSPAAALQLLPLRFEQLRADRYFVNNFVGDGLVLTRQELDRIVSLDLVPGDGLYERASEKLLVSAKGQQSQLQLLAMRLRSRMAFLQQPTALHIFVVTLRCEHSCPYCQVSRRSVDRDRYDMSRDTAMRALRVALSAPPPTIKIEFQGGEPLLNFALIQQIVEAARRDKPPGKTLEFVIATNLAMLDDDVLAFCRENSILLSTSLDVISRVKSDNGKPCGRAHPP